jgi:hypothetical protein
MLADDEVHEHEDEVEHEDSNEDEEQERGRVRVRAGGIRGTRGGGSAALAGEEEHVLGEAVSPPSPLPTIVTTTTTTTMTTKTVPTPEAETIIEAETALLARTPDADARACARVDDDAARHHADPGPSAWTWGSALAKAWAWARRAAGSLAVR